MAEDYSSSIRMQVALPLNVQEHWLAIVESDKAQG